jgi:hypothetical protein
LVRRLYNGVDHVYCGHGGSHLDCDGRAGLDLGRP